jgi:protoporphyrinogen oxidase
VTKKVLIIGSGFNALATAYFLKSRNFNVKILFERNIKGVLGSIKIENESFDLGYQFFDGLDKETDKFIRKMFSNNDLYDFKYGASTYSNNSFYEDHAMPYWNSYGVLFTIKAFIFYLSKFLKSIFFKRREEFKNLSDLFSQLPPNIRNILSKGCEKNFQIKPHKLDVVANEMSTFTNFRQTLFNDKLSNFLKKNSNFFDKHLASRRKSNNSLENISLYPKGKSMEFITDKLIDRLKNQDVIFEKCNFDEVNLSSNLKNVQFKSEKFDQVLITTSLSNIQRLFKINLEQNYEHYISQVFIYFTIKKVDFKFQYTQVNDINLYCSRISNCSLYSKVTEKNNHLLIAEMPLTSNSELWGNDKKLTEIAWNEIKKCGVVSNIAKYEEAKVLKVAKTFPVPKVNFFKFLNELNLNIQNKFSGNVIMIGQGVFTRHKFVKELINKYK